MLVTSVDSVRASMTNKMLTSGEKNGLVWIWATTEKNETFISQGYLSTLSHLSIHSFFIVRPTECGNLLAKTFYDTETLEKAKAVEERLLFVRGKNLLPDKRVFNTVPGKSAKKTKTERKKCSILMWTTRYKLLLDICFVQIVKNRKTFRISFSTTAKTGRSAVTCLAVNSGNNNPQWAFLLKLGDFGVQKTRVITTERKNHLFLKIFFDDQNLPRSNMS